MAERRRKAPRVKREVRLASLTSAYHHAARIALPALRNRVDELAQFETALSYGARDELATLRQEVELLENALARKEPADAE